MCGRTTRVPLSAVGVYSATGPRQLPKRRTHAGQIGYELQAMRLANGYRAVNSWYRAFNKLAAFLTWAGGVHLSDPHGTIVRGVE